MGIGKSKVYIDKNMIRWFWRREKLSGHWQWMRSRIDSMDLNDWAPMGFMTPSYFGHRILTERTHKKIRKYKARKERAARL